MVFTYSPPAGRPTGPIAIWIVVAAGLSALYALVFVVTERLSAGPALLEAAANVAPLIALATGLAAWLPRRVIGGSALYQLVWHAGLAISFTFAWCAASRVMIALAALAEGRDFRITGFSGPVLAWQLFQGLILYTAVAAIVYARHTRAAEPRDPDAPSAARTYERYLVRADDDFRPVEVADIISITGAQDYSEVATFSGRHLVRLSLAEFEARLDPTRFLRVHRSTIIHFAHLKRAEAAGGGRMLAHMANGERISVSRTGVKALRPLIV